MKFNISARLVLIVVGAVLVAAVTLGTSGYISERTASINGIQRSLATIRDARFRELEAMFKVLEQDLVILAGSDRTASALDDFKSGWAAVPGQPLQALQQAYIDGNSNPTGSKHLLDRAETNGAYDDAHGTYHPDLRHFLETKGLYDIFLVDPSGDIIYSVFKESDYATNLLNGKWKDTGIADAFRAAKAGGGKGKVYNSSYSPYGPSNDAPAIFFATPVTDTGGTFLGALIFQAPSARFNEIMQDASGLGETGETYIVGPSGYLVSDSRFSGEQTALRVKSDSDAVSQALSGNSGVTETTDFRDQAVMSAFRPLEVGGIRWAIIAEQTMEEIEAPLTDVLLRNALVSLVVLIVVSAIGYIVSRSVSVPIVRLTGQMRKLADGDLDTEVTGLDRSDEIGQMANTVQVFKENAEKVRDLEEEQRHAAERAEQEKRAAMHKLAEDFERAIGSIVDGVASAATELNGTAQSMTTISSQVNNQAQSVADSATVASSNVQTVAAASEELAGSIQEISRQVAQSTEISDKAVNAVDGTSRRMESLRASADKIGEVVSLINDIAEQTNLLALNATIEAARAGEAGKGFAVVASEVKNLANQTAKATDEIGGQVDGVANATREAVEAMTEIASVIQEMSHISSAIAAAIEEQDAATGEIARNVQEASNNTDEVTSIIGSVTTASTEAGLASEQVLGAASELSRQSEELRKQVNQFVAQVRAG